MGPFLICEKCSHEIITVTGMITGRCDVRSRNYPGNLMTESQSVTVLIVDDDESVIKLFRRWLEDDYNVVTALDGTEALEVLEREPVDIVLLDRRMPGISGDDVLETITEQEMDCQVAMVTAVEPDLDIVRMGFDDYVVKPPTREGIHRTIANLLARRDQSEVLQEYWSLLSKRGVLLEESTESELSDSEEFAELEERIASLRDKLEDEKHRMGEDVEFLTALRNIEDEAGIE